MPPSEIVITSFLPKSLGRNGQETAVLLFSISSEAAANCPTVYHEHWGLQAVLISAERSEKKR